MPPPQAKTISVPLEYQPSIREVMLAVAVELAAVEVVDFNGLPVSCAAASMPWM